ncbi:hypothetical protein CH267_06830 [Rhodococcus sp. 06-621-2]|nr:serine hydrolase domain-containing protein [Rhodococcus sp. 06-621-2]OZC59795.1 hypothetical protein CH267_06830 [Rhodococcus sp. 06-621-2]
MKQQRGHDVEPTCVHRRGNPLHGEYHPAFRSVAALLASNLVAGADVGAALCLYLDGRKVVDIWGGTADPATGREWARETLVPVFSCSKGVLTLCLLMLVEDGRVHIDDRVADHWPAFAAGGKQDITIEHVLAHQAGLPLVEATPTLDELLAGDAIVQALEAQHPLWEPGTDHAYHAITFGTLVGEIIRGVTGQSPGEFLHDRAATVYGLDTWIGLPSTEHGRVATLSASPESWSVPAALEMVRSYLALDDRLVRAATVNGALHIPVPGIDEECSLNAPHVLEHELPAANCTTTARSLAKFYAAAIGHIDGHGPFLSRELRTDATRVRSQGDGFFGLPGIDTRWGLGFQVSSPVRPMPSTSSFGHDGAGGALAFADHTHGVAFAYTPNQMGGFPDTRANTLVTEVEECLRGLDRPARQ